MVCAIGPNEPWGGVFVKLLKAMGSIGPEIGDLWGGLGQLSGRVPEGSRGWMPPGRNLNRF